MERIFCLPGVGKYVFHTKLTTMGKTVPEKRLIVASYILRKWRYEVSDVCSYFWHGFGRMGWESKNAAIIRLYTFGNKLTTRNCANEYFFKSIPKSATKFEFIFPSFLEQNEIKHQLLKAISDCKSQESKMYFWLFILPSSFLASKIGILPILLSNMFFTYNMFRVYSHYRAAVGAKSLKKALDSPEECIRWVPSDELTNTIKAQSIKTERSLIQEQQNNEYPIQLWKFSDWKKVGLHDDVVEHLEKELKLVELHRTYRRARLESLSSQAR